MIQKCALGVKVMFLLFLTYCQIEGQSKTLNYEVDYNIRPISEININGYGDAYPWISDDGLRLYYTSQEEDNGVSNIYSANRSNIQEGFSNITKLNINDPNVDNLCSWLSQDELNIAFVKRNKKGITKTSLFIANRQSTDNPFENLKQINLGGQIKGTILSPSFTQDLEQLIVYNEYRNSRFLLIYKKSEGNNYTFKGKLEFPKKYRVKTGKFSADGLAYYVSIAKHNRKPKIYILTRDNLNENFSELHPLQNSVINNKLCRSHQPYFSSNSKFVVFTRSAENEWLHNELFIGQVDEISDDEVKIEKADDVLDNMIDIGIYPNPSSEFVAISNPNQLELIAKVFDLNGNLIEVIDGDRVKNYINISKYASGSYLFNLSDKNSNQKRTFRVIKVE
ncbi:MAG: T9SS type A sorting domain-containing protein [Saprospiraceae bacterium]|nr:T9SS type A sorting domain-containing protein [Bacteroidia bacterium]NNE14404.1 T9SS type A sorting domain-containing protein [Saprospiraceae bacterium]NNL90697.1 T9SS type A sorting domain-containing protein [Saprospiraceae bacterium]